MTSSCVTTDSTRYTKNTTNTKREVFSNSFFVNVFAYLSVPQVFYYKLASKKQKRRVESKFFWEKWQMRNHSMNDIIYMILYKHPDVFSRRMNELCSLCSVKLDVIEKFFLKKVNARGILRNKNLNVEFIEKHKRIFLDIDDYFNIPDTVSSCVSKEIIIQYIDTACWDFCELSKNPNLLLEVIEKHIDKPWHWDMLSGNPCVTLEFIEKHIDKPWNWDTISSMDITMEFIDKYPDLPWNWKWISHNSNLTIEMINKYPEKSWDWEIVTCHCNITKEIMAQYPDYPWDCLHCYKNIDMSMAAIYQLQNLRGHYLYYLSSSGYVTMDVVNSRPDIPWCWKGLSENPNLTLDFIDSHIDKPWNWPGISKNSNITLDFIERHLDKPWSWDMLSSNPNLTLDFVKKYPIKPWNWENIRRNPRIVYEMINKYPFLPLDWHWIMDHLNLSEEMIEKLYSHGKVWQLSNVMCNKNLTIKFIDKHIGHIPFFDYDWIKRFNNTMELLT